MPENAAPVVLGAEEEVEGVGRTGGAAVAMAVAMVGAGAGAVTTAAGAATAGVTTGEAGDEAALLAVGRGAVRYLRSSCTDVGRRTR